jgi:glycosyltransferase involved in cell wall biosynthesis
MIVEPGLRLWGSERALAATLKALTEAWDRVVLVLPRGAELADEVRDNPEEYGPVEIAHAPIGMLHKRGRAARLRAMVALAGLALRLRPGRIYLNQAGLVRLLWPVVKTLGIPLAVHVRLIEDVARVTRLRGTPRAPLDLIFISDAMMTAAGHAMLADGTAWHNAYDPYPRVPRLEALEEVAPFVCVGRLSHGKGMHLLVEALAHPNLSEARADIYGAGVDGEDYADTLAEQAQHLGGRVQMMGFRHDLAARLPAYPFLVSTSRYEPLGRVVMEAWEAGSVPIVYAGSGGAAEMVTKVQGGLVFEGWSAASLAPVLARARAMPVDERRRLVAAGRAWIDRELNLQNYREALHGVLF